MHVGVLIVGWLLVSVGILGCFVLLRSAVSQPLRRAATDWLVVCVVFGASLMLGAELIRASGK